MIGVYAGVGNGTNLVAPFYIAACWVDDRWQMPDLKVGSYKECLSSLRTLNRSYKVDPRFQIQLIELSLFEVERLGIDLATQKAIKTALFFLDQRLIHLGKDSIHSASVYSQFKIETNPRHHINRTSDLHLPGIQLSHLFTETFRLKKLIDYHQQYPYLKLLKHKGYPTEQHLGIIAKLRLLPPFYIRELAFRATLKRILNQGIDQPEWFQNYLKALLDEGLIDIRNVGLNPLHEAEGDSI